MIARRVFRFMMAVGLVGLSWSRATQKDVFQPWWRVLSVALTAMLVGAAFVEIRSFRRGYRRPADEVPKNPLGIDS
jgi:hypothetical protein